MDNSTQRSELLIRYLDGEMAEGERQDFEKLLTADAALQNELESLQLAKAAVKSYGLKHQVAGVHKAMMEEMVTDTSVKSISKVRRIIRYSVSVAAVVLLIAGIYLTYTFFNLSPDKLYSKNYIIYELNNVRGDSRGKKESVIEKTFLEKKFAEVIHLNASSVLSAKDIFLTGLSYLETGDPSRAIASFQNVLADVGKGKSSVLKEEAEYYMALAYLKNRDYDQAIELMIAIHDNPSHTHNEKFPRKFIRQVKMLKWK